MEEPPRIFIDKGLFDDPRFAPERFGRVEAYLWLGCHSNECGHLLIEIAELSLVWDWSPTEVHKYLAEMPPNFAAVDFFGGTVAIAIGGRPASPEKPS